MVGYILVFLMDFCFCVENVKWSRDGVESMGCVGCDFRFFFQNVLDGFFRLKCIAKEVDYVLSWIFLSNFLVWCGVLINVQISLVVPHRPRCPNGLDEREIRFNLNYDHKMTKMECSSSGRKHSPQLQLNVCRLNFYYSYTHKNTLKNMTLESC